MTWNYLYPQGDTRRRCWWGFRVTKPTSRSGEFVTLSSMDDVQLGSLGARLSPHLTLAGVRLAVVGTNRLVDVRALLGTNTFTVLTAGTEAALHVGTQICEKNGNSFNSVPQFLLNSDHINAFPSTTVVGLEAESEAQDEFTGIPQEFSLHVQKRAFWGGHH